MAYELAKPLPLIPMIFHAYSQTEGLEGSRNALRIRNGRKGKTEREKWKRQGGSFLPSFFRQFSHPVPSVLTQRKARWSFFHLPAFTFAFCHFPSRSTLFSPSFPLSPSALAASLLGLSFLLRLLFQLSLPTSIPFPRTKLSGTASAHRSSSFFSASYAWHQEKEEKMST